MDITEIKPVILSSDDYDHDQDLTGVKRVVQTEFLAQDAADNQSMHMTPDNCNQMYNGTTSDTQGSTFHGAQVCQYVPDPLDVDSLLGVLRYLPRDLFITRVLKESSSCRERLETARSDAFRCVQSSEGYPFDSRASLKKRIQTRSGDSVEYKLANDIYCRFRPQGQTGMICAKYLIFRVPLKDLSLSQI